MSHRRRVFNRLLSTTAASSSKGWRGPRAGPVFGLLMATAIGATSYGVYQFYSSFTTYPAEVRVHLRAALRTAKLGEAERASNEFQSAWEKALGLYRQGEMGDEPAAILNLSAIAIRWGQMWEDAGELAPAIDAYQSSLSQIRAFLNSNFDQKVLDRGVQISIKIGDLFVSLGKAQAAETPYVWAFESLLRPRLSESQKQKVDEIMSNQTSSSTTYDVDVEQEDLEDVEWLKEVDVLSAMERLGALYIQLNKPEYAQPLLLQAINTILPPNADVKKIPSETQCHAATLMNNMSSTFIDESSPKIPRENLESATTWARRAVKIAQTARNQNLQKESALGIFQRDKPIPEGELSECEMVGIIGAYNLGKLSELAGDVASAKAWYEKSSKHASRVGFIEGRRNAGLALRRLEITQ